MSKILKAVESRLLRTKKSKNKLEKLKEITKEGNTAFCDWKLKKIIVPQNNTYHAIFHEIGHALNNKNLAGKALQKIRPSVFLATPIFLIGLFKTKKAPGEKPRNKSNKVTTFIKENAPALALATTLPMIIEEGIASLRGQKLAKKFATKEIAKKAKKFHRLSFLSYSKLGIISSLAILAGIKVKDAIAKPKLIEEKSGKSMG